jgi:hypothetical protein
VRTRLQDGTAACQGADLYDMNAPFVETLGQATHFKCGPEVYEGCISPWKEPSTSLYRERVEQGLPPFEVDGDWPWNEEFFPKLC